ncbi:hypothetical protein PQR34_14315 [Paraburkholderia sediminicola]|uniref:hypothetical protein n=1 Tax=Paraburkholderia sediminicola TaxID=458836 RepID=UPI0038B9DE81
MKELNGPLPLNQELRSWLATGKQQQLFSRYPLFFRSVQYPKAYPSNLAFFGIQCGLGWYPIVEAAAREIEAELRSMWCEQAHSIENMASLDHRLLMDSSGVYPVIPVCAEIREAAGQLEFVVLDGYLFEGDVCLRICESVEKAVHLARSVCERCGRPGELRERYWRHVYCDECTAPVHFKCHTQPAER